MMRRMAMGLCMTILAGLLAGCPIPQSQDTPVEQKRLTDQITGTKYWLYVPSTYTTKKKWPLVISLHGTWPWDQDWMQIREWKALAEKKGFIVIAPRLSDTGTQGIFPVGDPRRTKALAKDDQKILAVRREVMSRYRIDPKQVILTGFSSGGFPMYYTGLRHPEKFSMLIARACNSDADLFEQTPWDPKATPIPVAIFVGKDDHSLQKFAWTALRWLRRHGWNKNNSVMKLKRGGHIRRPETAWALWNEYRLRGKF